MPSTDLLRGGAAQPGRIGELQLADAQHQAGGKTPEQGFRAIVQQGGDDHLIDIEVVAQRGPVAGEQRGLAGAGDHPQQADQPLRLRLQFVLDQGQVLEFGEKRA
jgi:hypothetical protein